MDEKKFTITMEHKKDFEFLVTFDEGMGQILLDEPSPLGKNAGPNAARVLSAAIGNCLSASLLFCLQKARVETSGLKSAVTTTIVRNEKGRFRVGGAEVLINVNIGTEAPNRVAQCINLFEDFCIVTQSVRKGVKVDVVVQNQNGEQLYKSA